MKKMLMVVMAVFVVGVFSSANAMQETYVVKKGDTLSGIGSRLHVDWTEIARINGLDWPYTILVDQELKVPVIDEYYLYEQEMMMKQRAEARKKAEAKVAEASVVKEAPKVASNLIPVSDDEIPFAGDYDYVAPAKTEASVSEASVIEVPFEKMATKEYVVQKGDTLSEIGKKEGVSWRKIAKKNRIEEPKKLQSGTVIQIPTTDPKVTVTTSKSAPDEEAKQVTEAAPVPAPEKKNLTVADLENSGVPIAKDSLDTEKSGSGYDPGDIIELYFGGGRNWSADKPGNRERTSSFMWGKARILPLKFNHLKLGVFVAGARGSGEVEDQADEDGPGEGFYEYDWSKVYGGLTIKPFGKTWDASLDLGYGKMEKDGGIREYDSHQEENIIVLSANTAFYGRRERGLNLFPKNELNLEYVSTSSVEHHHTWEGEALEPDPYDDGYFEIGGTQWLYDIWANPDLRITPGVNLAYGDEYGAENGTYMKYGASVQLGTSQSNFLTISYKYKNVLDGDDGDQHGISGYLTFRF